MNGLLDWLYSNPDGSGASTWAEIWTAGGWTLYPLTMLGMAGAMVILSMVLVVAIRRARPSSALPCGVLVALGLSAAAVGFFGQQSGLSTMEEGLRNVDPADVDSIRAQGTAESQIPFRMGLLIGAPLLIAGAAFTPKRKGPAAPETVAPIQNG